MKSPFYLCLVMLATACGNPVQTTNSKPGQTSNHIIPEPAPLFTTLDNLTLIQINALTCTLHRAFTAPEGWVMLEEGMLRDSVLHLTGDQKAENMLVGINEYELLNVRAEMRYINTASFIDTSVNVPHDCTEEVEEALEYHSPWEPMQRVDSRFLVRELTRAEKEQLKGNLSDWKNAVWKYCGAAAGEKVKDYKYVNEKLGSIRQNIDVKISGKRKSDGQFTSKVLRFIPY